MPMPTKLGRVVTYQEELPLLKSCHSFIKWSCTITCQTKSIISRHYITMPMATKFVRIMTYLEVT